MQSDQIIGFSKEINYFKSLIASQRLSQAYIFSGHRNIGKHKLAKFISKLLNCDTRDACGVCQSCSLIDADSHPDVIDVKAEPTISIEKIRNIKKEVYLKNYSGYKVIIIDEAEKFTVEAANAFLKVLEEPPKETLIILITSRFDVIIPTIKSRVFKLFFSVDTPEVKKYLADNFTELNNTDIDFLLNLFDGRIGAIKNYLESKRNTLREQVFSNIYDKNSKLALNFYLSKDSRDKVKEKLSVIMSFLRDSLVVKCSNQPLLINRDYYEIINRYQENLSFLSLLERFDLICRIYATVDNVNLNILENLIKEIIWIK